MVIFELGKEIEKHVFRLGTSVEQKKNSTESNLRPFGSLAPMLYHLATDTLWWARPISKFI